MRGSSKNFPRYAYHQFFNFYLGLRTGLRKIEKPVERMLWLPQSLLMLKRLDFVLIRYNSLLHLLLGSESALLDASGVTLVGSF